MLEAAWWDCIAWRTRKRLRKCPFNTGVPVMRLRGKPSVFAVVTSGLKAESRWILYWGIVGERCVWQAAPQDCVPAATGSVVVGLRIS